MKGGFRFHALELALCCLLVGGVGAAWPQATELTNRSLQTPAPANAPLITLGIALREVKATKIRGVKPGQAVAVEVFGEDVKGANGFRAILGYDPAKVRYGGFTVGPAIPGLTGLNIQDNQKGSVELGGATIEGLSVVDRGPLGVVRFEALSGFAGSTDITLKSASVLRPEGRKDSEVLSTISLADDAAPGQISLDLDPTANKVNEIRDVKPGQVVQVEVFGEDIQGANGFRATLGYDPAQLKFSSFTTGPAIPGLSGLLTKDEAKGSLEVGGASVEGASPTGKGILGIVRFEVLTGFSGVAEITLSRSTVIRADGRKDADTPVKVALTRFGSDAAGPGPGPITPKAGDGTAVPDLDTAAGDQNSRTASNVKPGQNVDVQILLGKSYANASAFSVVLGFDTTRVSVVGWKKDGTAFSSAQDLPAQVKGDSVTYGASIFGGSTTATGALAVLTFKTSGNFTGDTEITLRSVTLRISGASTILVPRASVVLSGGAGGVTGLAADFDGDGEVGFSDFFMFAAAFGLPATGENAKYDLDGDKSIGFGDFFMFAADFGKSSKAKKTVSVLPGANANARLGAETTATGEGVVLRISASNAVQLRGYEMTIAYDPSVLSLSGAARAPDAMLSRGGPTPLFLVRELEPGRVVISDVVVGEGSASGNGPLAEISFRRIGKGVATAGIDLARLFDRSGGVDVIGVEGREGPSDYSLEQNAPNPFNPETQIAYRLPAGGPVRLTIYNVMGQVVRRMADGPQAAGRHEVRWDGRDDAGRRLASGVYLYRLEADGFSAVRRMMLVK